jgi:hypothetical protein
MSQAGSARAGKSERRAARGQRFAAVMTAIVRGLPFGRPVLWSRPVVLRRRGYA